MNTSHLTLGLVAISSFFTVIDVDRMQPTVAVGGSYGLMGPQERAPSVDGCVDGCPCGGSGKEESGDGIITFPCRCPEGCDCKSKKEAVARAPGPEWDWEGVTNPSEGFMIQHLTITHDIDATGMSRDEMQTAHDNAHNTASCPSGNCPTAKPRRRRGLFRW